MAVPQPAAYFARKRRRRRTPVEGDATADITGTAEVGQTLTAVFNNDDTAGLSTVLGYTWLRGAAVITGAGRATYQLVAADLGSEVSVRVDYRDNNQRYKFAVGGPTAEVA